MKQLLLYSFSSNHFCFLALSFVGGREKYIHITYAVHSCIYEMQVCHACIVCPKITELYMYTVQIYFDHIICMQCIKNIVDLIRASSGNLTSM